jgi:predicted transcriptional regulator
MLKDKGIRKRYFITKDGSKVLRGLKKLEKKVAHKPIFKR